MRFSRIELITLIRKLLLAIIVPIGSTTEEYILVYEVLIILEGIIIYYLIGSIKGA